jgi:hypothetical protein
MLVSVALIMFILIGLFSVAFLIGFLLGFLFGFATIDGYKSRKTCRECRRTIVECGFSVDGNEYRAIKKD